MKNFKKIYLPVLIAIIFTVAFAGVGLRKAFADDVIETNDASVSAIGFKVKVDNGDDLVINTISINTGNETQNNNADIKYMIDNPIAIIIGNETSSVLDTKQVIAGDVDALSIVLDDGAVSEINAGDNTSTTTIKTDNVSSSTVSNQSKIKMSRGSRSSHYKMSRYGHKVNNFLN